MREKEKPNVWVGRFSNWNSRISFRNWGFNTAAIFVEDPSYHLVSKSVEEIDYPKHPVLCCSNWNWCRVSSYRQYIRCRTQVGKVPINSVQALLGQQWKGGIWMGILRRVFNFYLIWKSNTVTRVRCSSTTLPAVWKFTHFALQVSYGQPWSLGPFFEVSIREQFLALVGYLIPRVCHRH